MSLRGAGFLVLLGTDSAIPADSPSSGGRELEGGGISPSPWPSPVRGEGISAEIATLSARNDDEMGRNGKMITSFELRTKTRSG